VARKKRGNAEEPRGFAEQQDRPRLTPVDVQQHVFRLAFRGYNERDVDEFLDQVTEDLAALHEENKRLREQVEEGGGGTGGSVAAARRQAETIVRQAREHAARLTATAGGAAGSGGVPSTFVLEERRFLQRIASLVQGHAGWLKEEARRARRTPAPSAPAPSEEPVVPEPVEVAAENTAGRSGVDEPTAAWSPEAEGPGGLSDEKDPLVSAWESAWAPEEPPRPAQQKTAGEGKGRPRGEEGEPSLRELFWGEE
jgi:DivIVA domain-containing protein